MTADDRPRRPPAGSHKTAPGALSILIWVLAAGGCAASPAGPAGPDRDAAAAEAPEDWGQDWARTARPPGFTAGALARDPAVANATPPPAARGRGSVWVIVLATFAAEGHPQAAANMVQQLRSLAPQLAGAWVNTTADGSMVVYGSYDGPESAEAQRDLAMVKQVSLQGVPAFPTAMLSRIALPTAGARLDPLDLMSVRRRFPNKDPLYTLEVAIWGDFESGRLSLDQIHRSAETYARQLRAEGLEAYYYHDDDKRLSTVTVGLFDHTAIDPRTGLASPQVETLRRRFPAHLVNGEELLEPTDGRNPARGTRVQRPLLVHVPKR